MQDECGTTWGHCIPVGGDFFGKPTETPHVCDGRLRHLSKLHRCAKCKGIGHRIMPTRLSKAGRQLAALIELHQKEMAAQGEQA